MRRLVVASCLALAGTAAHAADNGIYFGAAVTQANIDDILDSGFEVEDTSWKVMAGIRPLDFIAAELSYMDLGSESASVGPLNVNGEAEAFSAFGILFLPLPLPLVDVYGKLGLARVEIEGSSNAGNLFALDESGTEFAYGAGAQVRFGSLAARLEYEAFDVDNTDGVKLYSLGLTYTFF